MNKNRCTFCRLVGCWYPTLHRGTFHPHRNQSLLDPPHYHFLVPPDLYWRSQWGAGSSWPGAAWRARALEVRDTQAKWRGTVSLSAWYLSNPLSGGWSYLMPHVWCHLTRPAGPALKPTLKMITPYSQMMSSLLPRPSSMWFIKFSIPYSYSLVNSSWFQLIK